MGTLYQQKAGGNWYVDYTDGRGRRVRKAIGPDEDEAAVALRAYEEKARQQRAGLLPLIDNTATLEDLKVAFIEHVKRQRSRGTHTFYTNALKAILPRLHARTVEDLYRGDVEQFIAARLKEASTRTVSLEVSALKRMLNWAVEHELISTNPVKTCGGIRQVPKRPRRALTRDEVRRLLKASPEHYHRIWFTFLATGLRRSELIELRWGDLDFSASMLQVRPEIAKTRKGRSIPMPQELRSMLADMKREQGPTLGDHVFLNEAGRPWRNNLLKRFKRCVREMCEAARKEDPSVEIDPTGLHLHALRHTYGTLLYHSGVDIKTIQALLGHSTIRVTMDVYVAADANVKAKAVERLPFLAAATFTSYDPTGGRKVASA